MAAGTPSALAIETNCRDLARYALICQAEGLVPIVEPDLVLKGAHSLEDAVEANARVLGELVRGMQDYGVHLPGTLLKTNLVNCGKDLEPQASVEAIADANGASAAVFEGLFGDKDTHLGTAFPFEAQVMESRVLIDPKEKQVRAPRALPALLTPLSSFLLPPSLYPLSSLLSSLRRFRFRRSWPSGARLSDLPSS